MTTIEIAFLCAIFALYMSDCIYWVGHTEQAFTRISATDWKSFKIEPLSFTLLGRSPVFTSPFLIRPGFIRLPLSQPADTRTLRKVSHRLNRMYILLTLCRAQAFLLLVYLPMLLILHRLAAIWPIFLAILLITHITLSTLAIRALRSSKAVSWFTAASSIALNPLGATRAFDAISQAFFDQQRARPSRKP